MSNIISVAPGFQYSVNIAYDLNNDDKLKNFIPTKSALNLLTDILISTMPTSTNRSRILIGAYGKGKSHIMLMILSMLLQKDRALFEKTMPKIAENKKLNQLVDNYYGSNVKLLPVIITGSNTSLPQAFLLSLQRTLKENELLGIMPDTNYEAAVRVIERWRIDFPETYKRFIKKIDIPVERFISDLRDYKIETYEMFEQIHPYLTSGSIFNPFLGFDVVDLYEGVVKELKEVGYSGIYVVYDEFSKFLEANISEASVSDTKMLQDFAEKCNRSGNEQLHLMLISHKEIANYIDTLPKEKVDGWRGVSDRFTHVHSNNNFTQTYEIIASVIQKEPKRWKAFVNKHNAQFDLIKNRYKKHLIFTNMEDKDTNRILYDCYPLHPVSTFILPRLSELVAQNERTLFTFLSADGMSTLPAFLAGHDDKAFMTITPDLIYDYFEPLLKKEVYSGNLHKHYILTEKILDKLEDGLLESKIVKTLSLIYILEQFERLKPTRHEIEGIFSIDYATEEIGQTIANLIEREYVVYLKRSNGYLRLKETSGVDILQKIKDTVESQQSSVSVKDTLNKSNFDNYMYPSRYNDEREMTRYFSFNFIDEDELSEDVNWDIKSEKIGGDGIIFAIIPHSNESIGHIKEQLLISSKNYNRYIFIVPKHFTKIESAVREFNAASKLIEQANDDKVLFDEYEVVLEDLREVLNAFINSYTHPDKLKATYIYHGEIKDITRKASLTGLMSDICDVVYAQTPIINNEAINRNDISGRTNTSRTKIVTALLRNELEENLGFTGSGQEVSIMRSTLIRTNILQTEDGYTRINLVPDNAYIAGMLKIISEFVIRTKKQREIRLNVLYDELTLPKYHIGLRKGLIPIYLAAVFHEFKREIILSDPSGQVMLTANTMQLINNDPAKYTMSYLDWEPEKEEFVGKLERIFSDHIIEAEKMINSYDYVISAMKRWYVSLPKYAKEVKHPYGGAAIGQGHAAFLKLMKTNVSGHELLFKKLQNAYGYKNLEKIAANVEAARERYDGLVGELKTALINDVKNTFCIVSNKKNLERMSLASVIKDWCDTLEEGVFEQLFTNCTDKCLGIFRTVTNDDSSFIERLAKLATDLRLDDWDESLVDLFKKQLDIYKETAENFHGNKTATKDGVAQLNSYSITFLNGDGESVTKRFDKIEYSTRGEILYNSINAELDSMGQSITEQEKRQILMDVLKKLLY